MNRPIFTCDTQGSDLSVLGGKLTPRALSLVREWAELHRAELAEDWDLARAEAELRPIPPLE